MGDKSPKSKSRQQKQDSAKKTQEQAAAYTKAHPAPAAVLGKSGSKSGR